MAEKEENQVTVDNNEGAPSDLMSEIQKLRTEMFDKLKYQETEFEKNTRIHDQKLTNVLEKLQSVEDMVSKIQPEAVMETKDAIVLPNFSSSLSLKNQTVNTPEIGKSFVLKHVFKDAEKFEKDKINMSVKEDHFGAKWYICLKYKDDSLAFHLYVHHPGEKWEIGTEGSFKIVGPRGTEFKGSLEYCFKKTIGWGYDEYLKWEEAMKNYLKDGSLTAEVHVKIKEAKGLRKIKFRSFDESVKEVSDIVLAVKDRKFYVNRTFLAAQSSFFKALLLGNFSESKKSEVTLTGIDSEDFHFFLEVLYGEPAVDDITVEGIALLADMYDAPTAIRRCEEFLLEKSKKTLKKRLQMATRYNLNQLKEKCLEQIKTAKDIRSVLPADVQDLDPSLMADLLKKSLTLLT